MIEYNHRGENMKVKIRIKAQDDYIRVGILPESDQALLKANGVPYKYVSYDARNKISRVLEEIKHGKQAMTYTNVINALKKEEGPEFQYLSKLNPHSLWIELNRNDGNVNKAKEHATKLLLGLKRVSYHHVSNVGEGDTMRKVANRNDTKIIFFYRGLSHLINDIKEKLNERNSKNKGDETT